MLVIFLFIEIIVNILLIILLKKLTFKIFNPYLFFDKDHIEFIINKKNINISSEMISHFDYIIDVNSSKSVYIVLNDKTKYNLCISKKKGIKLATYFNKDFLNNVEKFKVRFKKKIEANNNEIVSFIKRNYDKIISTFIGLIISISSILLYVNFKDNIFLITILCLLNIIYSCLQFYFIYFKDKCLSRLEKIIFTFFATFLFVVIVSVVLLLGCVFLEFAVSIDVFVYSIMLLPSVLVVVAIIILLIMALGYV